MGSGTAHYLPGNSTSCVGITFATPIERGNGTYIVTANRKSDDISLFALFQAEQITGNSATNGDSSSAVRLCISWILFIITLV